MDFVLLGTFAKLFFLVLSVHGVPFDPLEFRLDHVSFGCHTWV